MKFERLFGEWCSAAGARWITLRYPRPEAGGETQAHHLLPRGEPRGAVLVAHGAGNDALFSLTGLFRDLLERQFEVFSFDLDGHGRASTTLLRGGAADSAIPAALQAWSRRRADLPLHAIGVSFGGSLLLHSLPRLHVPLASAALLVAPLRVHMSVRALTRETGGPVFRTLWRGRSRFGMTGLIPAFGPFRRDAYPLRLGDPPGEGAFGYVEVVNRILDGLRLEEAARDARVPVLLVYGGRDLLVPVRQAQRLHQLMPASELLLQPRETHLSAPLARVAGERLLGWIDDHQTARSARP